jgi:CBS domain-containing protein
MSVAGILKQKPGRLISIRPDQSVADVAALLAHENIGAVLVMDASGGLLGIVSERDIVRRLAREGAALLARPVSEIMTRDVICCAPGDSVASTMAVMTSGRFRHLPVRHEGRIVGMISIGDVVKRRVEDAEQEAESLREYIVRG